MSTVEMWARELSLDSSIPLISTAGQRRVPSVFVFVLLKGVVLFRQCVSPVLSSESTLQEQKCGRDPFIRIADKKTVPVVQEDIAKNVVPAKG